MLYAIFVRITLFIVYNTPPGNSTEHVFSYSDKMKTATGKVGGIMQERKHARFQEKNSKVCITRAAVNENVCKDSNTEHV